MRNNATTKVFALLIVFVMGLMQLFGGGGKYLCDCSGSAKVVAKTYCVGPHGTNCHEDSQSQSESKKQDNGDRKDHEKQPTGVKSAPAPTTVAAPAILFVAVLDYIEFQLQQQLEVSLPSFEKSERGAPPLSVVVARTVVRLI